MLGFEFDNNYEPFSISNLGQAVAVFMFDIIEAYITDRPSFIIYIAVTGVLGMLMNAYTLTFDFRKELIIHARDDLTASMKSNEDKSLAIKLEIAKAAKGDIKTIAI